MSANLRNYGLKRPANKKTDGKLLYADLTYSINGILFKTHNELGRYCNEQQVCDRIEQMLKDGHIPYKRELILPIAFNGEKKGRNRIDFIIDNKVVLEIKCKRFIGRDEYQQVQRYLHAFNKKLGILANFHDLRLNPRRVLNSEFNPHP